MIAWVKQLWALITKECQQIVRDPSSWLIAAVMPLIYMLLFGYGITLDAGVMNIAILNESNGAAALAIAEDFSHSPNFKVIPAHSRKEVERMMRDSVITGFVVFPFDFESKLYMPTEPSEAGNAGQGAPVQVVVSGAEPNTANFIRGYSQGVITNWLQNRNGVSQSMPVEAATRYWFNPAAKSRWFLVPGAITVVMTLIGTMLTALVIAREWERGTLEALYATPVSRAQLLLSKLIPYYALGMLSMILCTAAGIYIFHVPLNGSLLTLALLSTVFLIPALGQGLLISILAKEQLLAAQAGLLTAFLPAMILSGFIFDINSMPTPLQWLTMLIPARHFNTCLQTLFLAGDVWSVFVPAMFALLCLGMLLLGITYKKLVKRLE